MGRRKKRVAPERLYPESWTVSAEFKPDGKASLEEGTEFSVKGAGGRFKFRYHVVTEKGDEWVEAWGPVTGNKNDKPKYRSFSVDRVKTVHREKKARQL